MRKITVDVVAYTISATMGDTASYTRPVDALDDLAEYIDGHVLGAQGVTSIWLAGCVEITFSPSEVCQGDAIKTVNAAASAWLRGPGRKFRAKRS